LTDSKIHFFANFGFSRIRFFGTCDNIPANGIYLTTNVGINMPMVSSFDYQWWHHHANGAIIDYQLWHQYANDSEVITVPMPLCHNDANDAIYDLNLTSIMSYLGNHTTTTYYHSSHDW